MRARATEKTSDHCRRLFGDDPGLASLREAYAMRTDTVAGADRLAALAALFFWAAWACVTERPGSDVTYTNNWPPDELVGNRPTGALILWTGFSVMLLLAGIALLALYSAVDREREAPEPDYPAEDPLLALRPSPSMRATTKSFWVVAARHLLDRDVLARDGIVRCAGHAGLATSAVLFSTIVFLSGGIIGTFHHLYFAERRPRSWLSARRSARSRSFRSSSRVSRRTTASR